MTDVGGMARSLQLYIYNGNFFRRILVDRTKIDVVSGTDSIGQEKREKSIKPRALSPGFFYGFIRCLSYPAATSSSKARHTSSGISWYTWKPFSG